VFVPRETLTKCLVDGRRLGRSFAIGVFAFAFVYAMMVLLGASERVSTLAAFALLIPTLTISHLFRISFRGAEFAQSMRQALRTFLSIRSVWDDDASGHTDRTRHREGHT
jgi:hypothetical protein